MIGLLLLVQLVAPVAQSIVSYDDVPAEVASVAVFEWREGAPPMSISPIIERAGPRIAIYGDSHRLTMVAFVRPDGQYLLDGPFAWPADNATRAVRLPWYRSIRGPVPADVPVHAPVEWVRAGAIDSVWPRCFREDPRRWACMGLAAGDRGVLVLRDAGRLWWASVEPAASTALRSAAWGRLVVVSEPAEPSNVTLSFGQPVNPPAQRLRGIRLDTAAIPGAHATPLGPGRVWVSGGDLPADGWAEIRTERSGPAYIPLRDIAEGSATVPLHVSLTTARGVQGRILGPGDEPAVQALVTIFRLIDPLPTDERRRTPRRVLAAETVTDDRGAFHIDRIGEAEYEMVAWHGQLGRASVPLGSAATDVLVRLRPRGIARGRVFAGGRPAEGVDVVSVPDAETFTAVEDITDVKGGDVRTGPDGRFSVMVAASGGGELRIGGGKYAVRRIALARPPVPILDVGDIDLGTAIEVLVLLDRDPGCDVRAAGPVGRSGLQVVFGARTADGRYHVALPEPGLWGFGLVCPDERRLLSPPAVQIGAAHSGKELRFLVR